MNEEPDDTSTQKEWYVLSSHELVECWFSSLIAPHSTYMIRLLAGDFEWQLEAVALVG